MDTSLINSTQLLWPPHFPYLHHIDRVSFFFYFQVFWFNGLKKYLYFWWEPEQRLIYFQIWFFSLRFEVLLNFLKKLMRWWLIFIPESFSIIVSLTLPNGNYRPRVFYSLSFQYFWYISKTFIWKYLIRYIFRFAPRTFRADDFNDPIHLERISTLNTFTIHDLGAVHPDTSNDYTTDYYRINEWYKKWLPDNVVGRHDTKTTYQVKIRYANNTNETFTFHGPPGADEIPGPVKWTRPYFDCGRSNRWLVAAVVPIADIYPRHTGYRHIEYPT